MEQIVFNKEKLNIIKNKSIQKITKADFHWILVDKSEMRKEDILDLFKKLNIEESLLDNIYNKYNNPKIEFLDDYIYCVLKSPKTSILTSKHFIENFILILGSNFLITISKDDKYNSITKKKLSKNFSKVKPDWIFIDLIDQIIDNYFSTIQIVDQAIEELDNKALTVDKNSELLRNIQRLKRKVLMLNKTIWPLREAMSNLNKYNDSLIGKKLKPFISDIYENTIQIFETLEIFRDMLSNILEVYVSNVSNRLNEIMKVLTVIGTIFMPLTFFSGLYGMNFEFLPGLHDPLGFYYLISFCAAISIAMLAYFKVKKWW